MEILWITDPHLDHASVDGATAFSHGRACYNKHPGVQACVVTGDIGEARSFAKLIDEFATGITVPVYYVLGNHDAYKGSIGLAREAARKTNATWLTENKIIQLDPDTVLCGHDGWYDARFGDPRGSRVVLSDFAFIAELRALSSYGIIEKCREIADGYAREAEWTLIKAVETGCKHIVFATHVPPFKGACWHAGKVSDDQWLPWFTNKVMGETILKVAKENRGIRFTVLCGHTHGAGVYRRANVTCLTGEAAYGQVLPRILKWEVACTQT